MSDEFFKTIMGRQFFDGTMPRIARALEALVEELKLHRPPTPPAPKQEDR